MARLIIRVVDKDSGSPIAFVGVAVDGLVQLTDKHGVAEFDVPPGEYTVRCKPPFYEPATMRVRAPGEYVIELRPVRL